MRTRYIREVEELRRAGADEVIPEEFETSIEIVARVLRSLHVPGNLIATQVRVLRDEAYRKLRDPQARPEAGRRLSALMAAGTSDLVLVLPEMAAVGEDARRAAPRGGARRGAGAPARRRSRSPRPRSTSRSRRATRSSSSARTRTSSTPRSGWRGLPRSPRSELPDHRGKGPGPSGSAASSPPPFSLAPPSMLRSSRDGSLSLPTSSSRRPPGTRSEPRSRPLRGTPRWAIS